MPTLARADRAASLGRALETALSQRGLRVSPIVVVNGPGRDPTVVAQLARRRDIRLVVLEEAGLPNALRVGRQRVDTPYFAELDDDDELLPGALASRLDALQDRPEHDGAVTSGILRGARGDEINVNDFGAVEADPLRALVRENWLVPCAGLFRTDAVPSEVFEGIPEYLEWTYLGIRIVQTCRLLFLSQPTFVYHTDTLGSLSKSRENILAQPRGIERLLALDLPVDIRAHLRGRLATARHCAAAQELAAGNCAAAWRLHVDSLRSPRGWKYALYGRHVLYALVRPARKGR